MKRRRENNDPASASVHLPKSKPVASRSHCRFNSILKRPDCKPLPRLPDEVLADIFHYLSFEDRKNVRLVCQRCNDVCNLGTFLKNEKFHCKNIVYAKRIFRILEKTKRRIINLKFNDIDFRRFNVSWSAIRDKIHSLEFVKCKFTEKVAEIIADCPLSGLSLKFDTMTFMGLSPGSIGLINQLSRQSIVKLSVVFLSITVEYIGFLTKIRTKTTVPVQHIVHIFPNVTTIELSISDKMKSEIDDAMFSESRLLLHGFVNQIEKLSLNCENLRFTSRVYDKLISDLASMKKLNKLSLKLLLTDDQSLLKLTRLPSLMSLFIYFNDEGVSATKILNILTTSFPKLCNVNVRFDERCGVLNLGEVVNWSKIRFTSLSFINKINVVETEFDTVSLKNTHLRELTLRASSTSFRMVECFPLIENLFLRIDTHVINYVIPYQKYLKVLSLRSETECDEELATVCGESPIRNLTELEYLELWVNPPQICLFARKIFTQFNFPKLKYLRIELQDQRRQKYCMIPSKNESDYYFIKEAMKNVPKLEVLLLYYNDGNEEELFNLCQKICSSLPRLGFLRIESVFGPTGQYVEEKKKKICEQCASCFLTCTSLQVLSLRNFGDGDPCSVEFAKCKLTKKIINTKNGKKNIINDYFSLPAPKIGNFKIDWII